MTELHLQSSDLSSLEQEFLKACSNNDLQMLARFNADYSRVILEYEEARTLNSISEQESSIHLSLSHNIFIASSAAHKAQLAIDDLSNEFARKLDLMPALAPAAELASKDCPSPENGSSSSHQLLKTWSQRHMSYLFPSKQQLKELALQTCMSESQTKLWFSNARTRSGWSKLYCHKIYVRKDRERFQTLIDEYQSLPRLHTPQRVDEIISSEESYRLLDQVFRWFATTKQPKRSYEYSSVSPMIKEIISNALAPFKQAAAGVANSSKQLISNLCSPRTCGSSSIGSTSSPITSVISSSPCCSLSAHSDSSAYDSSRSSPSLGERTPISGFGTPSTSFSISGFDSSPDSIPKSQFSSLSSSPSSFQTFDFSSPFLLSSSPPLCAPTNNSSPTFSILSSSLTDSPLDSPSSLPDSSLSCALPQLPGTQDSNVSGQFDDAEE